MHFIHFSWNDFNPSGKINLLFNLQSRTSQLSQCLHHLKIAAQGRLLQNSEQEITRGSQIRILG